MPWIALVGPEIEENLSLRYLASALGAAGFETELVPFNGPGALGWTLEALTTRREPALMIALSFSFQWRALDFLALAAALRERGYRGHITAGGHYGTFAATELMADFPELDSICRHEAEETLVELARAVRDGAPIEGIRGLALRDGQGRPLLTALRSPPELAGLAHPDRRGEKTRCLGHPVVSLVGSRGCYARCSFCCIAAWHEQTLPGKRYRLRPVEDVADEMASLRKHQGADIFVFHDDNFFLPNVQRSLERIHALGDALDARGVGRIGTVVKARPPDVTREVFQAMKDRLGLTRVFLGIETDSDQGLATLGRRVAQGQNHEAMKVLADLGVYVCFNLLVFDPDTTLETFATNLAFMRDFGDSPFNFGRVELYAGTPLLERMQKEGRCTGDYLGWDYRLANPEIQKVFDLSMRCFFPRNFAADGLANGLMGTRFDVEIARHFHPESYEPGWLAEAQRISHTLARDSAAGLEKIVRHVVDGGPDDSSFVAALCAKLRATESELAAAATGLQKQVAARSMAPPADFHHARSVSRGRANPR